DYAFLAEGPIVIVHKEEARRRITRHVNVGPAIFVQIRRDHGHSVATALRSNARRDTYIGKRAIAVVAIQRMSTPRQPAWPALDGNSLPCAIHVFTGLGHALDVKLQVVRNKKIQMAVTIVVNEGAACAPTGGVAEQARFLSDVREGTVAVVAIELV